MTWGPDGHAARLWAVLEAPDKRLSALGTEQVRQAIQNTSRAMSAVEVVSGRYIVVDVVDPRRDDQEAIIAVVTIPCPLPQ